MLSWSVAAVTDIGRHRKTNDDKFFVSPDKHVFAVTDGNSQRNGHGAGASEMTVAAIEGLWHERPPHTTDIDQVKLWMVEAVSRANHSVWMAANESDNRIGMISTVVMAIPLSDGRIAISHVGDSRAYRIRDERAEVLTLDHNITNELIKAGKITLEQIRGTNVCKNYATRAIGHVETVELEQSDFQLEPGDTILLCTDGLSCVMDNDDIAGNGHMDDPAMVCENLLRSTIDRDAPDNVTVIAIHFFETEQNNLRL
jgi:serine/threonine protein phosphatase PrpC